MTAALLMESSKIKTVQLHCSAGFPSQTSDFMTGYLAGYLACQHPNCTVETHPSDHKQRRNRRHARAVSNRISSVMERITQQTRC